MSDVLYASETYECAKNVRIKKNNNSNSPIGNNYGSALFQTLLEYDGLYAVYVWKSWAQIMIAPLNDGLYRKQANTRQPLICAAPFFLFFRPSITIACAFICCFSLDDCTCCYFACYDTIIWLIE